MFLIRTTVFLFFNSHLNHTSSHDEFKIRDFNYCDLFIIKLEESFIYEYIKMHFQAELSIYNSLRTCLFISGLCHHKIATLLKKTWSIIRPMSFVP